MAKTVTITFLFLDRPQRATDAKTSSGIMDIKDTIPIDINVHSKAHQASPIIKVRAIIEINSNYNTI